METRIAPFTPEDFPACAALFMEVYNAPPFEENWEAERAARRLQEHAAKPDFLGLAVWVDEKLAGFLLGHCETWAVNRRFILDEICVRSEFRKEGLGSQMMAALMEALIAYDVSHVATQTGRKSEGEAFLRKCGFVSNEGMVEMFLRLTI